MKEFLTKEEKDLIRMSFTSGGFSMEDAIAKLNGSGYDDETAKALIIGEFKEYKKEMFERAMKRENGGEMAKVMSILIVLVSVIGPVMRISSPLWYFVAAILSGILGYVVYKTKPIAGILGGVVYPIAFFIAHS